MVEDVRIQVTYIYSKRSCIKYFSLRQYELRQVLRVSSQLSGYGGLENTPKVKHKGRGKSPYL
ncbi:MAG: hypothetical protein H6Q26_1673 [Bacteroidetes bacterium]|nr:hypothetical protein [Bacteroidota bacterium]